MPINPSSNDATKSITMKINVNSNSTGAGATSNLICSLIAEPSLEFKAEEERKRS